MFEIIKSRKEEKLSCIPFYMVFLFPLATILNLGLKRVLSSEHEVLDAMRDAVGWVRWAQLQRAGCLVHPGTATAVGSGMEGTGHTRKVACPMDAQHPAATGSLVSKVLSETVVFFLHAWKHMYAFMCIFAIYLHTWRNAPAPVILQLKRAMHDWWGHSWIPKERTCLSFWNVCFSRFRAQFGTKFPPLSSKFYFSFN